MEERERAAQRDEIAEKCRFWNSVTVNARLADTFAPAEVPQAAVVLAGLAPAPDCPEDADETACRMMLDAIRLSEGNLVKLALWVEAARSDPRDLIAAAEYPRELAGGGEAAREADLRAYLGWVAGGQER